MSDMMKSHLVSDSAERRARGTAREIAFAIALTAAAALSFFAATVKIPDSETASNFSHKSSN
jgi:hypothetical protein